jgi:hypothetical protein
VRYGAIEWAARWISQGRSEIHVGWQLRSAVDHRFDRKSLNFFPSS